jgi:hypothetical protein
MRTKKTLVLLLAAVMMLCSLPVTSSASTPGDAGPAISYWINTSTVTVNILFGRASAINKVDIDALSGSSIEADIYLYAVDGGSKSLVESWLDETSGSTLSFSESCPVNSGCIYRLEVEAVVTRNGRSETITSSAERTAP